MSILNDLINKVVVITGGTGLIGRELCKGFLEVGSKVVFTSRTEDTGKFFEKELTSNNGHIYIKSDITNANEVDILINTVMETYGKIDIWINNAFPRTNDWKTNIELVTYDSIKKNIEMQLAGYFLCSQKVSRIMKDAGSGNIINFSSVHGVVGPNFSVYENTGMTCDPAYPLIKGGIITMTKYFATYFAKYNVRVNCICPGGIFDSQNEIFVNQYVKQVPLGRMAMANEIVGPALFLASEISSYITGHCLMVDGGLTAW